MGYGEDGDGGGNHGSDADNSDEKDDSAHLGGFLLLFQIGSLRCRYPWMRVPRIGLARRIPSESLGEECEACDLNFRCWHQTLSSLLTTIPSDG
jgi:hypothetical protein